MLVSQSCLTLLRLHGYACQAPLSTGFSRQEDWSGLPFSSPGDLPDPGSSLRLLHCRQILYHLSHLGSPLTVWIITNPGKLLERWGY